MSSIRPATGRFARYLGDAADHVHAFMDAVVRIGSELAAEHR